jgi:hypothetical protein
MLCRTCFQCQATFHVLDRPSDDGLVESHYCLACYEHLYGRPPTGRLSAADDPPKPADPLAFPRPRFAIKDLMWLAGSFAVLNAALALFMRSGLVQGTPAQVETWTIKAFLIANPFFGVLLAEFALHASLRKRHLHQLSDGVRLPDPKAIPRLVEIIAWERASLPGRACFILYRMGPLLFIWVWASSWIPRRILYSIAIRNDPWLVAAAAVSLAVGLQVALFWALVASTRRR